MLSKYCTKCNRMMPYNGRNICDECSLKMQESRKDTDRLYNQRIRNRISDKFYHSKEWKNLSKMVLARAGYKCEICGRLAVEVHHINPISTNWDKRFDIDNLTALCTSCHNKQR